MGLITLTLAYTQMETKHKYLGTCRCPSLAALRYCPALSLCPQTGRTGAVLVAWIESMGGWVQRFGDGKPVTVGRRPDGRHATPLPARRLERALCDGLKRTCPVWQIDSIVPCVTD
jgi:hypothetical protein